jgi:hypothetical protein
MRLSRFHFDIAFLGGLLLLGAVVVRGWMAEGFLRLVLACESVTPVFGAGGP